MIGIDHRNRRAEFSTGCKHLFMNCEQFTLWRVARQTRSNENYGYADTSERATRRLDVVRRNAFHHVHFLA